MCRAQRSLRTRPEPVPDELKEELWAAIQLNLSRRFVEQLEPLLEEAKAADIELYTGVQTEGQSKLTVRDVLELEAGGSVADATLKARLRDAARR